MSNWSPKTLGDMEDEHHRSSNSGSLDLPKDPLVREAMNIEQCADEQYMKGKISLKEYQEAQRKASLLRNKAATGGGSTYSWEGII